MPSAVEIVNLALDELGKVALRDFSTTPTDPISGRLAKRRYEMSRDWLVSKHDWTFARCTVLLNLVSGVSHPDGAVYGLPADCLVPRRIGPRVGASNQWEVEGRYVIIPTDYTRSWGEQPRLRYTRITTQSTLFPSYFIDALALHIASKLAMPLNCDQKVALALNRAFQQSWREAALIDSNIGNGDSDLTQDLQYDTFITTDVPTVVFSNGE